MRLKLVVDSLNLSYQFNNKELLQSALRHRSATSDHNERLEFLGDSVLGVIISEALYQKFEGATEGSLSRLRASLVNQTTLANLARRLDLGQHLLLSLGEEKSNGRNKDSILSDAYEALIAAIYLDSNMEVCRAWVLDQMRDEWANLSLAQNQKDPKSSLQEWAQAQGLNLPLYQVIEQIGPDNDREFVVLCRIDEIDKENQAKGRSKKQAEQAAAAALLDQVKEQSDV